MISIDAKQDCLDFQAKLLPEGVLYTYKRSFDTCDEDDYVIEVNFSKLPKMLILGSIKSAPFVIPQFGRLTTDVSNQNRHLLHKRY